MPKLYTQAWYADIGAKSEIKRCRTEIRKIETILHTRSIAGHLSSSTINELCTMVNTISCIEDKAKLFRERFDGIDVVTK